MNNKALQERLEQAEKERDYYASLVDAFFEGRVPVVGSSLAHNIMAQWGRKRHEQLKSQPALLRGAEAP